MAKYTPWQNGKEQEWTVQYVVTIKGYGRMPELADGTVKKMKRVLRLAFGKGVKVRTLRPILDLKFEQKK